MTGPEPGEDRVELSIPGSVEWLALARTTGAAIASRWSFTYDEIADLRLAIDELCLTLVESASPDRIELTYFLAEGSLHVTGHAAPAVTVAAAAADGGSQLGEHVLSADLSARILDALVDEHGMRDGTADGTRIAWFVKKRSSAAT